MAILGYNTKGASSGGSGINSKVSSKFTLAENGTLTELHAWVGWSSGSGTNIIVFIYADSAGTPAGRLAYTAPIATPSSAGDAEISQSGFSVPLTAGDYWIGWGSAAGGGRVYREDTGGTSYAGTGTFNPPPDPYGTPGTLGARKYSVWAVYTPAAVGGFVPQIAVL